MRVLLRRNLHIRRNGGGVEDGSEGKVLTRERVRFEIAGGSYRLVAAFDFRRPIAFVKFIGTMRNIIV
jgi:hypothetical protein